MAIPVLQLLANLARKNRDSLRRRFRRQLPGRFQAYSHTLPNRYPWLFDFASASVADGIDRRILSFGCSRGEEVFSLRGYFPNSAIKGIDIEPTNISRCESRARTELAAGVTFAVAANTEHEPAEHYDAIFCLAVLCLGDLTVCGAQHCDPHLYFRDFERMVADFSRCLKPGGTLFLLTTNFRFSDTAISRDFDVIFEATPGQLAPDVLFDSNNTLLPGERYLPVGFRKRPSAAKPSFT